LYEAKITISDGSFEAALSICLAILETQNTHSKELKWVAKLSNKTAT